MGVFSIRSETILRHPDTARAILKDLIVVKAESTIMSDEVEYTAIGDCFDEVQTGEMAPYYRVNVWTSSKLHNTYQIRFTK